MPSPSPKLIQSHPYSEETRREVAVKRGPLVYCLEAVDLPEGVRPIDIVIPSDITFDVREDGRFGDLLPGAITCTARRSCAKMIAAGPENCIDR